MSGNCQGCGRWTHRAVLCDSCIDKHEREGNFVITVENAGKCFALVVIAFVLAVFGFLTWAIVEHGTR